MKCTRPRTFKFVFFETRRYYLSTAYPLTIFIMPAVHLTDDSFDQEVLKADVPVLVDFFATWCGPCKAMSPIIDQLGEEAGDKFKVAKIDVDENNMTASKYQVMSIPTLIIFHKGEIVYKFVGVQDKNKLKSKLEEVASK